MRKYPIIQQKQIIGKVNCDTIVKTVSYITASILLLIGGFIYIGYRHLSLAMFKWTNTNSDTHWLLSIRSIVPQNIPDWVKYALPDGLWACSYVILIGTIWDFKIQRCWGLLLIVPMAGVISELLQGLGSLPGVFDWKDLIAYITGLLMGLLFLLYINTKRLKRI